MVKIKTNKNDSMKGYFYEIIRKPLITEKAMKHSESGKYTFKVADYSTKKDIKLAIEKLFDVKLKGVNIINQQGKSKVFKGIKGKRSGYKKAIVSLQPGESLDLGIGA